MAKIAIPLLLIAFGLVAFYGIYFHVRFRSLKRVVNGIDDYRLWLSKKERQALAREMKERDKERYNFAQQQAYNDLILGKVPPEHIINPEGNSK